MASPKYIVADFKGSLSGLFVVRDGSRGTQALQRPGAYVLFLGFILILFDRRLDGIVCLVDVIKVVKLSLFGGLRWCVTGRGSIRRLVSIFSQKGRAELPKHDRVTTISIFDEIRAFIVH